MLVKHLIEELEKHDPNCKVFFGEVLDLIGGRGASINKQKMGLTKVKDTAVIYLEKEEDEDARDYLEIIQDFE